MPIFTVHMTHSVESCPVYNEDTKKKLKELSSKRKEAALEHQINILTAVFSQLEHLIIYVMEAPSHKAVERYLRDLKVRSDTNKKIFFIFFLKRLKINFKGFSLEVVKYHSKICSRDFFRFKIFIDIFSPFFKML